MKQVVIVADIYLPRLKSTSFLLRDLAIAFAALGIEVLLVVADSDVPTDELRDEGPGIRSLRVKAQDTKKVSFWKRGFRELALSSRMLEAMKKHQDIFHPTLVVVYSPSIFLAEFGGHLRRRFGVPCYLIVRDVFPDWAIEAGVIRNPLVRAFLSHMARRQYQIADRIGLQSTRDLERFKVGRHGRFAAKSELLRNWRQGWVPVKGSPSLRAKLGLEGKTIFLLGGSIGPAQDPEFLLELAIRLRGRPEIHFLVVGGGPLFAEVQRRIAAEGHTNVTLVPEVPFDQYKEYLATADVGVLLLSKALTSDNVPGRFLDYLQASRPVLALLNPGNELLQYVVDRGVGLSAPTNDANAAELAVTALASSPELRTKLGSNGPEALKRDFDPETAAKVLLKLTEDAA